MRIPTRLLATCLLMLAFLLPDIAFADTPATRESVLKLMAVMGINDRMAQIWPALVDNMRKAIPNAPDAFFESMKKQADVQQLLDQLVPIYMKDLSEEDVQATITFYQSPQGQHLLNAMPALMKEGMQVGMKWGKEQGQRIMMQYCSEQPKDPACNTQ